MCFVLMCDPTPTSTSNGYGGYSHYGFLTLCQPNQPTPQSPSQPSNQKMQDLIESYPTIVGRPEGMIGFQMQQISFDFQSMWGPSTGHHWSCGLLFAPCILIRSNTASLHFHFHFRFRFRFISFHFIQGPSYWRINRARERERKRKREGGKTRKWRALLLQIRKK